MARILLVEADDAAAASLASSLSGRADWTIERARSVMDAIRKAGEARFDAAVLDHDLPDGNGLDLLDFLRVGSPDIRILVLSSSRAEDVAFRALTHGARDCLTKDHRLERELPLRLEAALDGLDAVCALVETLHAHDAVEAPPATRAPPSPADTVSDALLTIARGGVEAAIVWDTRGRVLAARATPRLDADGMGFALATLHGQVGSLWTYATVRPTGYSMLIDVEGGLVGVTAIPGTYLVGLLFEHGTPRSVALRRLDGAASAVHARLRG